MGADVKFVPLDKQFRVDLDAIAAAISDKTKLIWICNPNNPTGTTFNRDAFYAFVEALPDSVWVVLDEAYIEFAKTDNRIDVTALINAGEHHKGWHLV